MSKPRSDESSQPSMSQQSRIVVTLREMILNGELLPGQRIVEIPLAEQLGASRTPIRYALGILEKEGLVVSGEKRGYFVRSFTLRDIVDAIEVRAVLEGLACRLAAESAAPRKLLADLRACLETGDALFAKGYLAPGDAERYEEMNSRFHGLIVNASQNAALINALTLNDRLPFAGANAVAVEIDDEEHARKEYDILKYAHCQHHDIVEALERGQGGRAEALMKEHANIAIRNITLVKGDSAF